MGRKTARTQLHISYICVDNFTKQYQNDRFRQEDIRAKEKEEPITD